MMWQVFRKETETGTIILVSRLISRVNTVFQGVVVWGKRGIEQVFQEYEIRSRALLW